MRALFDEFPDENLAGFIIWVPMLPDDSAATADAEERAPIDPRIRCWFDADKSAANAWSSFIALPTPAWDVYAIYDGAASWSADAAAPRPRIWMHQLNETPATHVADTLDPGRLAREWLQLLGRGPAQAEYLAAKLRADGAAMSSRADGTG